MLILIAMLQHMDKDDDAYAAVKGLDGTFFAGSNIKVEVSRMVRPLEQP